VLKASGRDLPFIIISGTIGEETAVASLKAGAHDFLIKDRLARLIPAIERELRESETRRERRQAELELRASEERFRQLADNIQEVFWMTDIQNNKELYISPAGEEIWGRPLESLLQSTDEFMHTVLPEDRPIARAALEKQAHGEQTDIEYRIVHADGSVRWIWDRAFPILDETGKVIRVAGIAADITERKLAQETLRQQDEELQKRNVELIRLYRASEALLTGALADLPALAQTIVHTVLREFEQSNCSLLLVNRETRELERLAVQGTYAEQVKKARLSVEGPGLAARAIRTGQVINARDVSTQPDYIPNWDAARSELVIPLKIGEEVIGALDVQSPEPDAFHQDDERLMTIFAERAALALERSRLHEQTMQQLQRLEGLRTIDLAISSSMDLRVSLNIVLEQVIKQLGVDAASVLLWRSEYGRLEFAAGRGFRTRNIESSSLRPGEGHAGRAAFDKRIIQGEDLTIHPEQFTRRELLASEEFVSYFGVPLIAKGEVKGVLETFNRSILHVGKEWLDFLESLGWQTAIAIDNALLFEGIQRSNIELAMAYDATIEGWSRALDLRDHETEGHTQRVTEMTLKLAPLVGFRDSDLIHIRRGALLHDIGKMGVPDHILLKPSSLTEEEWVIMNQHPQFAYDLLRPISFLRDALRIPYAHHEKWDGTGYPRGLSGTQIPLEARLFAIVDNWDALTSDRPYRKKWTEEKTLQYIRDQSGKHFDPQLVEIFLREILHK
jgi:PAS domain S-box-containing protein